MQYPARYVEREGAVAVARRAEANLGSVEEETIRLRSWAAILGVSLVGTPFLRFQNGDVTVNVGVTRLARPNAETGVSESELPGGRALALEDVPFNQIASVLAGVAAEEPCAEAARAEFHRSADGFRRGTLVIPMEDVPQDDIGHVRLAEAL